MTSVDDFLDRYEPPVEEVAVCGRAGLVAEHARTEAELAGHAAHASLGGPPAELVDRLRALEAEIESSAIVITVQARTSREWADVMAFHPPKGDAAKVGAPYDVETWEPAILAACAIDPVLSAEQAVRMRETLPPGEWRALMEAVVRVNGERVVAPKSLLLSALALVSDDSWGMPPAGGSLGEPSLADNGGQ